VTRTRQIFVGVAILAFTLEALAVPICCRLGYMHMETVFLWGGVGLLFSVVSLLAVRRNFLLHVFFWLCVGYWLSGYIFMYSHSSGGSIIVFHAEPTKVNRCMARFYRPWFVACFGCSFGTDPIKWDT